MQFASPEDLGLINKLIDQGLVEKKTLIAMLESKKQAYEQLERQLHGKLVLVDPGAQKLLIRDQASDEILLERDLAISRQRPGDWEKWGTHLALVHATGGSLQASLDWALNEPYGLVLSEAGVYHYDPKALKADWLGSTQSRLYGGICRLPLESGPYDLYLAPDQSLLALCNRGEGSIEILSTQTFTTLLKVKLRPSGGATALNLAFDLARRQLLITDQTSSVLSVIALDSGELTQQKLGLGLLGNLAMAPDREHLYLLTVKPNQEVVYLRCSDWHIVKTILLKGDLFSGQTQDPCDLMALSPDGQHLLLMSSQHSPAPYTPLLSVIDTQQVKTIRRYALKDGNKPCQLLFCRPNPLLAFQDGDVRDLIVSAGLLERQVLDAIDKDGADAAEPESAPLHPMDYQSPQEFIPPTPYILPLLPTPVEPAAEEPVHREEVNLALAAAQPPPASRQAQSKAELKAPVFQAVDLDPEASERLLELLVEDFSLRTGISLEHRPGALELLQQEATRLRQMLGHQPSAAVELEKVAEGRGLRTVIYRRALELRQEQHKWLRAQETPIVPLECPQCRQKLMGHWECQVCGFELESPLRTFAHQVASAEPIAGLASGHFLLPDPQGMRLLELNGRKEVVWCLDHDQLSCECPVDLIRLPGDLLLVADAVAHKICEIGLRGKIHWSFQTSASERHRLNRPVRVGYYRPKGGDALHYLIVDQGHHRVLEVDREHRIHWEFGVQGEAGSDGRHLSNPSDLQYTPERTFLICDPGNARVLEVDPLSGLIERSFDQEGYGLVRPLLARRLWDGRTLIVDGGNFQVLELNRLGTVTERISFYKPGMPPELKLQEPCGLVRLRNQDLILYNDRKVLHLLPLQKKLIWVSGLRDLRPADRRLEPVQVSPEVTRPQPPAKPAVAQPDPPPAPPAPQRPKAIEAMPARPRQLSGEDRVQALIHKRTVPSNKESFEHSVIFTSPEAELQPLSLYLLDWRHNAVLRVNRKGKLTWHYGFEMGQELARPAYVQECPHSLLITDADHHRVLEVSKADKEILHTVTGPADRPLANPRSARLLESGNYLIADSRNKRLVELSPAGELIWEFRNEELVASPQYVEELPDGDLLFCDSLLNRVLQIDRLGHVQWYYGAPLAGKHFGKADKLFGPGFATRLANGSTLIA
ncbi:MAG: hypothetical protein ACAI44_33685, partial [Candidatus Sericytochromatia bacterium]